MPGLPGRRLQVAADVQSPVLEREAAGSAHDKRYAAEAGRTATAVPADLTALTPREREVLTLMGRGLSNTEIATELTLSEATVKSHVARIFAKLGLRDHPQAVVIAYETGGEGLLEAALPGVSFAGRYGVATGVHCVLIHPGATATGFSGVHDSEALAYIGSMQRHANPSPSHCRRSRPPSTIPSATC
ncbi:hypothetical protein SUDANB178_00116 [Streptomyces sp. enrichment culture]